jgi:DNA-binding NtrC family response regulator
VPIYVPPLRERKEDIPILVEHFLQQLQERLGRPIRGLTEAAMRMLMRYHWPGNVRELQNVLEYGAIVCQGEWIDAKHILPYFRYSTTEAEGLSERERILQALEQHHWRIKKTAQALGIDRTTLWRKMKRYGIYRE